jgi:hypothetical protein
MEEVTMLKSTHRCEIRGSNPVDPVNPVRKNFSLASLLGDLGALGGKSFTQA